MLWRKLLPRVTPLAVGGADNEAKLPVRNSV